MLRYLRKQPASVIQRGLPARQHQGGAATRGELTRVTAENARYLHELEMLAAFSTNLVRQTDRRALIDLVCTHTRALLNLESLCLIVTDTLSDVCLFSSNPHEIRIECRVMTDAGFLALDQGIGSLIRHKDATVLSAQNVSAVRQAIPEIEPLLVPAGKGTVATISVEADTTFLGVLLASRANDASFSEHDLRLLTHIAHQIAYALERIQITEAQRRHAVESEMMLQLSAELAAVTDMSMAASIVADQVRILMNTAAGCLLVVNRTTNRIEFSAFNGALTEGLSATDHDIPADLAFDTFWQHHPVFSTPDFVHEPRISNAPFMDAIIKVEHVVGLMAASMSLGKHGYGILIVAERQRRTWSLDEQATFIRFSRYIGSQLDNVWLYEEQRRHYEELDQTNALLTAAQTKRVQLEAMLATARGVSHLLSQPLTVILGYAALLQSGEKLSDEEMHLLETSIIRARDIMQKFNSNEVYAIKDYSGQDSILNLEGDN